MLKTCSISQSLSQIDILRVNRQNIPLNADVLLEVDQMLHRLAKIDACNTKTSIDLTQKIIELSKGDDGILEKLQGVFVKKFFKEGVQKIKSLGSSFINMSASLHVDYLLSELDPLDGVHELLECVSLPFRSKIMEIIIHEDINYRQEFIYLSSQMLSGLCDDKSRLQMLCYLVSLPVEDRESICTTSMSLITKLADANERISFLNRCFAIDIERRADLLSSVFYLSISVSDLSCFVDILDVLESIPKENLAHFVSSVSSVAFLIADGHKRSICIRYLHKIYSSVIFDKVIFVLSTLLSGSFDDRSSLEIVKKIVKMEAEVCCETLIDLIYLHVVHTSWSDRSLFMMKVFSHVNPIAVVSFLESTSSLMKQEIAENKYQYLEFFYGLLLNEKISPLTAYFPLFFSFDTARQGNILLALSYFEKNHFEAICSYIEQQSQLQRIDLSNTVSIVLSLIEVEIFKESMCDSILHHLPEGSSRSDVESFLTGIMRDKRSLVGVKNFSSFIERMDSRFSANERKDSGPVGGMSLGLVKANFADKEWTVDLAVISRQLQMEKSFNTVHNLSFFMFKSFVDHLEKVFNNISKEEKNRIRNLYFKDSIFDIPILIDNLKTTFFEKMLCSRSYDTYGELVDGIISFFNSNSIFLLEETSLSCRDIALLLFSESMMKPDFFKKLQLYKTYEKLDSQYKREIPNHHKKNVEKQIVLDLIIETFVERNNPDLEIHSVFSQSPCKKGDKQHQIPVLKVDFNPIFPADTRGVSKNKLQHILNPTFIAQETMKRFNQLVGEDRALMNEFISTMLAPNPLVSSSWILRYKTNSQCEMQLDDAFELLVQMKILQDPSNNQ